MMNRNSLATFILLGLNVFAFVWTALGSESLMMNSQLDVLAILHAGANLNPFTLGGEPWRIIMSMFLHFGIFHLLVNMFALYSMGRMLEPEVGPVRFLMVYFFCGIASGLFSLLFNVYTISAGASGALFGLYGYRLGAELIGNFRDRKGLNAVVINFIIFVVINAFITTQFSVDIAGHIGGCIAGLFLAVLQHKLGLLRRKRDLAIVLVLIPFSLFALPKDQLYYYRIFQRVLKAERYTNQLYRNKLTDFQIKDSLVAIVPEWDSIGRSLHALQRIPSELRADTANLANYVKLRRLEATFRIALIEHESYVYLDSLEIVDKEFDGILPFQYSLNYSPPEAEAEETKTTEDPGPALETRRVFYDAAWKEIEDPSASVYYRIGSIDSLGRWQGQVYDYYRNGSIQMKGKYLDGMKNGVFLYYSERGRYASAGRYVKEDAVGKWESYHWNGALETEVYYNNGAFTKSVMDSLGNAQVVNGKGKAVSWHPNGQIAEEGSYYDGRREGDWFGFHEDGKPYYHELYRDNRLVHGVSEDKDGKRYVYDQLSQYPFPVTGMKAFNEYLNKNRRVPDSLKNESGIVKVIFNVGVDGSIWDFVVIKSLSLAHDQEAIRLIEKGPSWRPGLLHGHIKRPSQGYVEVIF
ncbi:MAG: rhomboid family intramembrane serine protease [Cyclobacteriaceae bacterium]|nr:rhomboid family intramembrane serine protease [Cyclobacteriaceae bacterium]MDH5248026.1 rhomboid family intramembrane serine protease [Cyclobacteriaceae bacterium]